MTEVIAAQPRSPVDGPTTDHPFVVVEVTAEERAVGELTGDRLGAAVESLTVHGAAILLDAVDLAHCERLYDAMMAELDEAASQPPALGLRGHVQHNPPPRAEHLHVDIFANPVGLSVVRTVLGPQVHLSLYTGNTMLGHTFQEQPVHWDEPQLWSGLSHAPPASSLIINIPLVDVALENGALELWPGTHIDVRSGDRPGKELLVPETWLVRRCGEVPPVRVPLPRGALLLRDSRLWHRGTTNVTDRARPMVAMLYSPWWSRPYAIDFYPDAEPVLRRSGLRVTARYREVFDHHVWPPSWELVPKPLG